jgi:hypothetical protein
MFSTHQGAKLKFPKFGPETGLKPSIPARRPATIIRPIAVGPVVAPMIMPVVVVMVVVIVGQRVTQHTGRRDANRRRAGVDRLDRTTVSIVGGHATDPAQRDSRSKGEDKGFANQWVFHGEVKPNSRMPEGANGF